MSATRTGRPRSIRASRSITRSAAKGSPGSATIGGSTSGSGSPAGAGRRTPSPMAGTVVSVTGSVISDWITRDWRKAYHRLAQRTTAPPALEANRTSPGGPPGRNRSGACFMLPGQVSGGRVARCEPVVRQHDTSTMPPMDPDSIPTEPIIDPGPLDATDVAPGPSQVSGSPTDGRGRGTAIRRAAIGLALALTFTVGIGVGRLVPSVEGGAGSAAPSPTGKPSSADELALIGQAWDILHEQYVGKDQLDDRA